MFHRQVLLAGAGALALAATPAIAAGASQTSHARLFRRGGTVALRHQDRPSPPSAEPRALRRAGHSGGGAGRRPVRSWTQGQAEGHPGQPGRVGTNKAVTLASGATWSKLGVTCEVNGTAVTCTNAAKHGFTIGNRKYKSF